MTIVVDIGPEVEAALARQASIQGRAIETIAASMLEEAVRQPSFTPPKSARKRFG